jgi:hypothetical protein
VVESWNWKMPFAGTLVSSTLSSKAVDEGTGVGVGVGVATGVGVGVGPADAVLEPPPPHDHEPAITIASKAIQSLPKRIDGCLPILIMHNSLTSAEQFTAAHIWDDFKEAMPEDTLLNDLILLRAF